MGRLATFKTDVEALARKASRSKRVTSRPASWGNMAPLEDEDSARDKIPVDKMRKFTSTRRVREYLKSKVKERMMQFAARGP